MPPMRERDVTALSLFSDEMKAAREQRGWSQADLADRIPYSLSTISMVEALHRVPTREFAMHLDKAFGTPGTFARLEARLRDLPFPASFRPLAAYEAEATALYVSEHSLVYGLLQTPEYARAVFATRPNTTEDEMENLVAARLARQDILTRDDPPRRCYGHWSTRASCTARSPALRSCTSSSRTWWKCRGDRTLRSTSCRTARAAIPGCSERSSSLTWTAPRVSCTRTT